MFPASFRDQLIDDHRLVLTPFTVMGQRCVDVYPYGEWQKLLTKFEGLPKFGAKSIRFQMGYIGRSHRSEIDSAGRILLPTSLRQHADLKRDVVVAGHSHDVSTRWMKGIIGRRWASWMPRRPRTTASSRI